MKFTFKKFEQNCRLGQLTINNKTYETPLYMIYIRRGGVPHLTQDLLFDFLEGQPCIFNLTYWDLHDLLNVIREYSLKKNGTLHEFLNLKDCTLCIGLRDPVYHYTQVVSSKNSMGGQTQNGQKKVTPDEYVKNISILKPELFIALHDPHKERLSKNKDCTTKWLKPQCNTLEKCKDYNGNLFAVFMAGNNPLRRLDEFINNLQPQCKGITFSDFGLNENPEKRFSILSSLITKLGNTDAEKLPRMVNGQDHPYSILECVERGIDLFDGSYPFICADFGHALTFPCDLSNIENIQPMIINLRDSKYRNEAKPILQNCGCLACRDHTKAYIHHLFNTQEMLGYVLLSCHNLYHYLNFFKSIRKHIQNETFTQFKEKFFKFTK